MSSQSTQPPHTPLERGEEQQPSQTQVDPGAEIARLKRRLAASQDEVKELTQGKVKKPPYADLISQLACYRVNYP